MRQKLYGNHIEPRCGYCANGRLSQNGEQFLCAHKGFVPLDGACRHFRYDPLKREPELPATPPSRHTEEDFSL